VVATCCTVACVIALTAVPVALGAEHQVDAATDSATFTPSELTVNVGDTVTISRADGGFFSHNSRYADQQSSCPATPMASAWSCSRTFDALGDYTFHCDLHTTMTGTVHVVSPSSGGPPPTGSPPPAGSPPPTDTPAPDTTSPGVVLAGATAQRVLRSRAVVVKVRTDEAATLTAAGTVSVPPPSRLFRLRKVTGTSAAGELVTLKLRLSRRARVAVRSALTSRRKPRARVRVTATDAAGNRTVSSRRIALKR
jgi:plastocyanin